MSASLIYLLLLCVFQAGCQDYYWRDFDDFNIPSDALEIDSGVYIGQAFPDKGAFCVGTLIPDHPGQNNIEVPCPSYSAVYNSAFIKIMCTKRPADFSWMRTTASSFREDVANKRVITGGYIEKQYGGPYYIGRVNFNGKFYVGIIRQGSPVHDVPFYYAYNGTVTTVMDSYEVLIYVG